MDQGFIASFTGNFLDGTPIRSVSLQERKIRTVRDNLSRIFSAREGIQPHLKEYGLPDISEIYRQMPQGIHRLQEAIERAIARYEHRLCKVKVRYKENRDNPFIFEFTITGEIAGVGQVAFTTNLSTTGIPEVSSVKK